MTIEVCQVRNRQGRDGYYIGRPSSLGNPFVIGRDGSRAEVVAKYREWLAGHLAKPPTFYGPARVAFYDLLVRAQAGEHIRLYCYCAPLACHGDVIKELLEHHGKKES